jgi:hypothetical protein
MSTELSVWRLKDDAFGPKTKRRRVVETEGGDAVRIECQGSAGVRIAHDGATFEFELELGPVECERLERALAERKRGL